MANIILNCERIYALLLRLEAKQECVHLNSILEFFPGQLVKKKKVPGWKEKLKVSQFADGMILYVDNLKENTYIHTERKNKNNYYS